MSRILLLLILIAGPLLPLRGEVFMLWPWKGGGTASGESLAGSCRESGGCCMRKRCGSTASIFN